MDDNSKHASTYQLDQETLDARGIDMTVEEVVGLSTCKYADRVHSMKLSEDDLAFLKGLRRRIKNRLASQNSRRRSVEHLRRLTRELRAVRACRRDAILERRTLVNQRDTIREHCVSLREYLATILQERSDNTQLPSIEIEKSHITESHQTESSSQSTSPVHTDDSSDVSERDNIFECRIDKLVQQSVDHIFRTRDCEDDKKIFAKTIFINEKTSSEVKNMVLSENNDLNEGGVLNLSLKEGRRRNHGRKQSAPRRIVYCDDGDDCVLDLKIKKETP